FISAVEISGHGSEHFIIRWIQIIKYRARKLISAVQFIQEGGEASCLAEIAHGVETCIGPQRLQHSGVVISQCTEVKLLGPTFTVVHPAKLKQGNVLEVLNFVGCQSLTVLQLFENSGNVAGRFIKMIELFQSMIGKAAAQFVKNLDPFLQRTHQ